MDGKTKVCGIMANPVEHSYSPMMQNFFGERTARSSRRAARRESCA